MPYRTDLTYRYDGSFEGLLTCIFESYACHELPQAIMAPDNAQTMLFESRLIKTDYEKARRVERGIIDKVSQDAFDLINMAHLSCIGDRDRLILLFVRFALQTGPSVMNHLSDERVNALIRGVSYLEREAHLYKGFVRFSDIEGVLVSVIQPKNSVLTLLNPHFSERYNAERFIIYDSTHRAALMHMPSRSQIVPLEEFHMRVVSASELQVQALWKRFHETIAIEGRVNPKHQRGMLPLRYRSQMTEFQDIDSYQDKREGVQLEEGSSRCIGAV